MQRPAPCHHILVSAILTAMIALPAAAQSIQKCTQADGSVVYQQDVCPAGSSGKVIAVSNAGSDRLTLPPNANHQYFTTLTVNGITVTGIVDTGATYVTISPDTAARMHIAPNNPQGRIMQTANGLVQIATQPVAVLKIGKFELYNVELAIAPNSPTLIGMSALSQLNIVNENGNMVLNRR